MLMVQCRKKEKYITKLMFRVYRKKVIGREREQACSLVNDHFISVLIPFNLSLSF